VAVWSAVAASCALPGIFDSFTLMVKEPNGNFSPDNVWTRQGHTEDDRAVPQRYSDGSLENDLPMKQLSELFNVNHFIVSQVNPHSAMLASLTAQTSAWSHPLFGALMNYVRFLRAQCKDWFKNVISLLVARSLAPAWSTKRGVAQALMQDYEGREEVLFYSYYSYSYYNFIILLLLILLLLIY
jgi:TAG lipase/steryl ester hydrolase/phospholipase A2/LPA acyltransferase